MIGRPMAVAGGHPVTALRARVVAGLTGERWRQLRSPLLVIGLVIVGLLVVVALAAPLLSPYDPRALAGDARAHPGASHLLGTNDIGQDIASQLIWGARNALLVSVTASTLAVAAGAFVGIGAGLAGGVVDLVVTRIIDLFLALPGLPLLVLVAALLGGSRTVVILLIANAGWPQIARTLRSQALTLRERGFVTSARAFGGGTGYLIRRHLAPAMGPLLVSRWVDWAATAVFLESGLAVLGLTSPTTVSWGTMLDRAFNFQGWYFGGLWTFWVLPAGLAITVAVIGFTMVGVGLEQAFNPRWARDR